MGSGGGHPRGVDYERVDATYLERRRLRRGAAGWVLLAGLGVSSVVSGDFAGWNFGLAHGGWGGLLVATALMATMYTCMVLGLAELAAALPVAGAGYGFARRALGPLGGFATGVAILVEYAIAPAAIAVFISGYVEALGLFGLTNSWPVHLVCYAVFVGIHLRGVGEALRLMFAITAVAVVALLAFAAGMVTRFDTARLFDIAPTDAPGASAFLPFGVPGVLAALVYGIWFFLAVEGVPLAAEEARDPRRDMPRGIIGAMLVLLALAAVILVVAPGGAGSSAIARSDNPLPHALVVVFGGETALSRFVNYVGLAGLVASFFSIIYAYSRQLFALSRAGYLPRWLSLTGRRGTPYTALLVPGTLGFLLAATTGDGELLINVAVFGATLSYVLMMVSHIVLRFREPDLPRPYRTPGGVVTTGVALALAVAAVVATFLVDPTAAAVTAGIVVVALLYFVLHSRRRLVADAPEEEFAALARAERELT
ncbi:ethanolamine:proton symporter, EAT family [Streptoalloteichus tenebrarius]|uniref:Ethanolamine:proton symporter, EAT family n=1 Tax=Streptoalloteichus tenebrarius (strain ATCC 17920 / DSM 40477 / JCM 4838 / CBS 697.72 / NBRC 16177 / NCIMB 11028 / NRRL B-12390 / A12253. 1 / ISP 5477) TaxID=1933 RepID=A0ABT1I0Z7_STRSD|nr:ethanolamine permease [Streptoalloteichus tenebrarius]MCP2261444.1 ethanolamine:proton symporter, EAT family [Streptoalloteichus tenebrarius]BFE99680.1 ethanolamine permease [Streptoalloteichus tenebrarius]